MSILAIFSFLQFSGFIGTWQLSLAFGVFVSFFDFSSVPFFGLILRFLKHLIGFDGICELALRFEFEFKFFLKPDRLISITTKAIIVKWI